MKQGNLWKKIRESSRRTGNKLSRKIKIGKPFGLAVMILGLIFLLVRLAGGAAGKGWRSTAAIFPDFKSEALKSLLLQDKVLFQYLFYEEEERGPFRIFSESVLDGRLYLAAASENQGGIGTEAPVDWKNADKISELDNPDGAEEQEDESTDQLLTITEDGLLENVLSENAAWEEEYLPVSYLQGNVAALEKPPAEIADHVAAVVQETVSSAKVLLENHYSISELSNVDYLLSTYYIVDSITRAVPELFDAEKLLSMDLTMDKKEEGYQILIYHTHASEEYCDSADGEVMDTVRGPGEALAEYLRGYGYTVYHDMTAYDRKDGKDNRNLAYSTARPAIEAFLAEHPEVEVIIDLHRDSGEKRVATINGKETARIMLFNGLCRNASGPIADLENPNLQANLAFSLQVNLTGRVLYPDLMFRIYLKNYRYNQHFRQRYLLVELGTDKNTVEEAYNAMEPFAEILDAVLRK